ncbi:PASTA domain-containing protein [Marinobacter salexigens]|uniref:PASTA domain-containing protein n=1 Tax=Marinobacter salexigens TaxID=1925763 RepID=UPI000C287E34|nr:PASTA domain-containing protein [Marinobacter salexigens]
MIRAIVGTGTLLNSNGKPAANLVVNLQLQTLKGGWKTIAQSRTTQAGSFKLRMDGSELKNLNVMPHFRLAGGRGEVLAENPLIEVGRTTLIVDFGKTVRGGQANPLRDRLAKSERESQTLKAEKDVLMQRFLDAKQTTKALEKNRDELAAQIAQKDVNLIDLKAQLEKTEMPQSGPMDDVATQEISRLKLQLLSSEIALRDHKAREDTLNSRFNGLTSERDNLKAELDELRGAEAAAPQIGTLATTIANSLRGMEAEGVELADARITLKGYLADGGNRFKPFDAAELSRVDSKAASEISFGVRPKSSASDSGGRAMPDVVGLTPASAARILRPLGRRVEVIEVPGKPVGAIITQNPAAGGDLPPETIIRLMVAIGPQKES